MKPKATPKIRIIPVDKIVCTGDIQTRARLDDETVTDYSVAMLGGAEFPPVVLFKSMDGTLLLADGFHRVAAARKAGHVEIPAEVRVGERKDAIAYALSANAKHGLRRTNADKRRSVEIALREFVDQSDRRLAELCCVTDFLVRSVRSQVRDSRTLSAARRVGKDGKTYPPRNRAKLTSNVKKHGLEGQTEATPLVQLAPAKVTPDVTEANTNHGTQADQQIISTFRKLIEKAVTTRPGSIAFFRSQVAAITALLDGLCTIPAHQVLTNTEDRENEASEYATS